MRHDSCRVPADEPWGIARGECFARLVGFPCPGSSVDFRGPANAADPLRRGDHLQRGRNPVQIPGYSRKPFFRRANGRPTRRIPQSRRHTTFVIHMDHGEVRDGDTSAPSRGISFPCHSIRDNMHSEHRIPIFGKPKFIPWDRTTCFISKHGSNWSASKRSASRVETVLSKPFGPERFKHALMIRLPIRSATRRMRSGTREKTADRKAYIPLLRKTLEGFRQPFRKGCRMYSSASLVLPVRRGPGWPRGLRTGFSGRE